MDIGKYLITEAKLGKNIKIKDLNLGARIFDKVNNVTFEVINIKKNIIELEDIKSGNTFEIGQDELNDLKVTRNKKIHKG